MNSPMFVFDEAIASPIPMLIISEPGRARSQTQYLQFVNDRASNPNRVISATNIQNMATRFVVYGVLSVALTEIGPSEHANETDQ